MSIDVDIKQLDDGDGIEAMLMRHHAGWHKTACLILRIIGHNFDENNSRIIGSQLLA